MGGSISKYSDLSDLLQKKYGLKENISFAGAGTQEMGIWLSTEVSDFKMIHF